MNELLCRYASCGHYFVDTIILFFNCVFLGVNLWLYRNEILEQKLPYLSVEKKFLGADIILKDKHDSMMNSMNFRLRVEINNSTEYLAKDMVGKAEILIADKKYDVNFEKKKYIVSKKLTITGVIDKLVAMKMFDVIKSCRESFRNGIDKDDILYPKLRIKLCYKSIKGKCVMYVAEYTIKNCSMTYKNENRFNGIEDVSDLYECDNFDFLKVVCHDTEEWCELISKSEYDKFL